ncbi:MAG: Gfo/Idh/MocA family oxidoreductase, partial [Gammaproteobacteria bacterium]|nr:Gfo/Idh/MocA family oxidoreductase [Gammaproteobacteria bacterium]
QLLRAQGCKVLGIDFGSEKLEAASGMGAAVCNLAEGADPVAKALAWSRGRGVDGVLIAASTKSSDPVSHAAKMSRKRGKIVLVGSTGLELSRSDFYEKELSFQVSCSYGPGRYDSSYELKGIDYPIGFVRWTEQRNFEAVLDMMADGKIDTASMLTDRFDISNAADAYERLASDKSVLALLLDYPSDQSSLVPVISLAPPAAQVSVPQSVAIGCIGSGNYAGRVLLPAAAKTGARLKTLSSAGGVSAAVVGRQLGFEQCSSEAAVIFDDADINAVLVATRHDTHATYVVEALNRGKNVFVEKPLGLDTVDLERIESAYIEARRQFNPPRLMVGFNRRFSPLAVRLKSLLSSLDERMAIVYTCNAGAIPADHWTQDPEIGGGRIIGEACHFVDFVRYLAASPIKSVSAIGMRPTSQANDTRDVASISVDFVDGSIASINYLANGHPSIPKERIEVYQAGRVFALNNFRSLIGNGVRGFRSMKLRKQNKGQLECIAAFVDAIKRGIPSPIDFDELIEVSKFAIEAAACLSKRDSKRESA